MTPESFFFFSQCPYTASEWTDLKSEYHELWIGKKPKSYLIQPLICCGNPHSSQTGRVGPRLHVWASSDDCKLANPTERLSLEVNVG